MVTTEVIERGLSFALKALGTGPHSANLKLRNEGFHNSTVGGFEVPGRPATYAPFRLADARVEGSGIYTSALWNQEGLGLILYILLDIFTLCVSPSSRIFALKA